MAAINPYLNFPGNTEEAFNFYKSVFGGEFTAFQRFRDNPDAANMPDEIGNQVMHVALPIGRNNILMGTDAPESMGFSITFGNNQYICINAESRDEATKLFAGLSADGSIELDIQDMWWGAYYGSFSDKFGTRWMVNYTSQ